MPALKYWDGAAWVPLAGGGSTPTIVAALPGSPVDGQEVYYQSSAMATDGIVWHLRYRAGSASTYKWECLGGGHLFNEVTTSGACTSVGAYVDLASTGPDVTVPLAGDYDLWFGAGAWFNQANLAAYMAPAIGASAAADADSALAQPPAAGAWSVNVHRSLRKTGVVAASLIRLKYRINAAGTGNFERRWLRVMPVRVG